MADREPELFREAEQLFGIRVVYGEVIHMYHLRKKLKKLQKQEYLVFVRGSGKHKSSLQKFTERLDETSRRLRQYVKHLHIAGKRNSYSKTDHDATFMRMKEDAMLNGQLKPAYNIQFSVDAEYVVWITAGPQPTDTLTLIPFLKEQEQYFQHRYQQVVADSGYESEENYLYLEGQHQQAFIKPSNYEKGKTRNYRKDIGRRENMVYDATSDCYQCAAGKLLTRGRTYHRRSRSGFLSEVTCYSCKECQGCALKSQCIKGNNCKLALEYRNKHFEVSKYFQQKRAEALTKIPSAEGILLRMNRSIQSEGAFGEVKSNMDFRRFLCRGHKNILAESILAGIAPNVNKLHSKIQRDYCGEYLHTIKAA